MRSLIFLFFLSFLHKLPHFLVVSIPSAPAELKLTQYNIVVENIGNLLAVGLLSHFLFQLLHVGLLTLDKFVLLCGQLPNVLDLADTPVVVQLECSQEYVFHLILDSLAQRQFLLLEMCVHGDVDQQFQEFLENHVLLLQFCKSLTLDF